MPSLTVAVCTRDRPAHLARALDALDAQSDTEFELVVVDQSDRHDEELGRRADARRGRFRVLQDTGRGLSRARNAVVAEAATDWIAFVDDDCLVDPDWVAALRRVLARHPDAAFVSGHVGIAGLPPGEHLAAAARPVERERVLRGRWVNPQTIGFGVCMAVRRDIALQVGGWDERFGAGVSQLPASEDVDFNFRLLRAGATAVATPDMRAWHDQWRTQQQTVRLYEGYARSWAAFSVKHVRTGDARGGIWLWSIGLRAHARMAASALRHRSRLRARVCVAQLRGLLRGTLLGLTRHW